MPNGSDRAAQGAIFCVMGAICCKGRTAKGAMPRMPWLDAADTCLAMRYHPGLDNRRGGIQLGTAVPSGGGWFRFSARRIHVHAELIGGSRHTRPCHRMALRCPSHGIKPSCVLRVGRSVSLTGMRHGPSRTPLTLRFFRQRLPQHRLVTVFATSPRVRLCRGKSRYTLSCPKPA